MLNIKDKVVGLKSVKVSDLVEKYFVGHGSVESVIKEFEVSGLYRIGLGCRGGWEDMELIVDENEVLVRSIDDCVGDDEDMRDYYEEFYGDLGYEDEGYMFGFGEEDVDYFVRVVI